MFKGVNAIQMGCKLRVAVDCRITDFRQGVGTAVLVLAKAFSDLSTTDQEYTFIVREQLRAWLEPYIHGPCKLVSIPESKLSTVKASLRWIKPLRFAWNELNRRKASIPSSDGYV